MRVPPLPLLLLSVLLTVGLGCGGESGGPASTATPSATESAVAQEVLVLVNAERKKAGVPPLSARGELDDLAWIHSDDMLRRGYFDHDNPEGDGPEARAKAAGIGFTGIGENIAKGQESAAEAVESWMNSPPHRENILDASFTRLGVGVRLDTKDAGENRWTQVFLTP